MNRKTITILLAALSLMFANSKLSSAQAGSTGRTELSQEEIARSTAIANAQRSADQLLTKKLWADAVLAYKNLIAVTRSYEPDAMCATAHYGLARAYVGLDQLPEALDAFRNSLLWSRSVQDLGFSGEIALDYAEALRRANRLEDAKVMYYAVLRGANGGLSPVYPFLVVFDPEPGMTAWSLTKPRLEAALLMLKHQGTHDKDGLVELDRIRAAAPEWILPALVRALSFKNRDAKIAEVDKVYLMASTEEEQGWIDHWRQYIKLEPKSAQEVMDQMAQHQAITEFFVGTTKQRLKNSTVLEAARVAMEKDPLKLVGRIVD